MNDRSTPRRRFLAAGGAVLAGCATPSATPPATSSTVAPTGLAVAPTSQSGLSPRLTFHGIDTQRGGTAPGLTLDLSVLDGAVYRKIGSFETVAGGRVADPLLLGDSYRVGRYEVLVHVAAYYERLGVAQPKPPFLSSIPLRFAIHDASERVHLPVLFTPWSYSYYRGS